MADNKKNNFFENLSPTQKRYLTIACAVAVVVLALFLFTSNDKTIKRNNEVQNVLTDVKGKDLGIDSLLAQMKIQSDNLNKLQNELKKVTREQELARSENSENRRAITRVNRLEKDFTEANQRLNEQVTILSEKLTKANEDNERLKRALGGEEYLGDLSTDEGSSHGKNKPSFEDLKNQYGQHKEKNFIDRQVDLNDPEALYATAPLPGTNTSSSTQDSSFNIPAQISTSVFSETESQDENMDLEESEPEIFIPAGSMLKGVLLAGLDAPTGTNARQDPFPVQVRIQKDAILPNGYKADLKECFLLMSGYGDMSSERALLRGETLSCIRDDGAIIQTKLPSYAAGEDGKAGLRGRLVSKTGTLLAKTLLAGFASGVSQAFDVNMTPTINTSSDGTVSYEKVYAPEAFQGAAISGVSNALDKLADYYMSMAEEMFPIIEIDGGREVTVIVSNGASMTVVRDSQGNPTQGKNVVTAQNTEQPN